MSIKPSDIWNMAIGNQYRQIKTVCAVIAKEPQRVFWGGYSGYFTDPNGYYWEARITLNGRSTRKICLYCKNHEKAGEQGVKH